MLSRPEANHIKSVNTVAAETYPDAFTRGGIVTISWNAHIITVTF